MVLLWCGYVEESFVIWSNWRGKGQREYGKDFEILPFDTRRRNYDGILQEFREIGHVYT